MRNSRTLLRVIVGLAISLQLYQSLVAQSKSPDESESAVTRTGTITGRVVADGQPVPNATVFVYRLNQSGNPRMVPTNDDGAFQVKGLDLGVFSVRASAPAFAVPLTNPVVSPEIH